nr:MAG TPA: hypothetical protein [Caudoviricetes sp.]
MTFSLNKSSTSASNSKELGAFLFLPMIFTSFCVFLDT